MVGSGVADLGSYSNSELKTWKRCRRKWYLAYFRELGVPENRLNPTGALQLGTRVHNALEAYYGAGRNPVTEFDQQYIPVYAPYTKETDPDIWDDIRKEHELGRIMIEGYIEWLAETGADTGIEVVAAEAVVVVPFPAIEGVTIRAKLDGRIERKVDGRRLFIDHKTTASITEPQRTLHMDEQMKYYHLIELLDSLARTGAEPPKPTGGALYNMLKKVKRTVRATPPFYARLEVSHNMDELRTMYRRVQAEITDILSVKQKLNDGWEHHDVAYPNPMPQCTWDCSFFALCGIMDDGSRWEEMLDHEFVHVDPHLRYNLKEATS